MKKKPLKFKFRRKVTPLAPGVELTYKNPEVLERYVTEQGSIMPRSVTSLSQKQQRQLSQEVKRARHLAMMMFTQTI